MQGKACIRWSPGCSRPMGAIAIGRMYGPTTPLLLVCSNRPNVGYGPTTPLLRVCSNRPHGRVDDDVATQVPLHDLASRGPSAINRTDGRYRSKTTGYPVSIRLQGGCMCLHDNNEKRKDREEILLCNCWDSESYWRDKVKKYASAGNRTRAARVAGEHSTTEPPMLVFKSIVK